VQRFLDWCRANNVRGELGEFGIPDTDPRWFTVMENFLHAIDAAGVDATYWAAGEWWGSYPLSVQPTANFTVDRPQLANLQQHAPGRYLAAFSAASLSVARAVPGSLVTIYGNWGGDASDLAVRVTSPQDAPALGDLLYSGPTQITGPTQINFRVPLAVSMGRAAIEVLRGGQTVAAGSIAVASNAPAIFTSNAAGFGLAAAHFLRVQPDGTQTYTVITSSTPISFGDSGDRTFLVLYGTGVRGVASVEIGGILLAAAYAGPQGQFPGLDQINVELPRSLAGDGLVNATVRVDGVPANTVQVAFQ
jgi:uncharacterized protein (TIGR03437 family)